MTDIVRHGDMGMEYMPYNRETDTFMSMVEEASEVIGYDLVKDDLADALEGVPFLITRLTFRPGFPDRRNREHVLAYVSAECVIADEEFLKKYHKSLDGKPFYPGQHVVLNDGSTGIYRQLVQWLDMKGYITLPEDMPASGPSPECRYDTPPADWTDVKNGETWFDENIAGFMHYQVDVRILAPRGLRISSGYENDWTQDGKTRYLG